MKITNNLNLLLKKKKSNLYTIKKLDFSLLKIFLKINIIKFIKTHNNKKTKTVYSNINNTNINNYYINLISSKKKKITLNFKNMLKNKKLLIISTNKGVFNSCECLKKKLGGIVLLEIILKK